MRAPRCIGKSCVSSTRLKRAEFRRRWRCRSKLGRDSVRPERATQAKGTDCRWHRPLTATCSTARLQKIELFLMGICLPFARWRPPSSPQQSERTERQQAWPTSTWRYGSTSEASCSGLKNRQKSPRPTSCCLQLSMYVVGTVHVTNKVFGPALVWTRSARVGSTRLLLFWY